MDLPEGFQITTKLLLQGGLVFALADIFLLLLLSYKVKAIPFESIIPTLPIATAIIYGGIWVWAIANFWESVYGFLFPPWSRWIVPAAQAVLTGAISYLAVRLALRVKFPSMLVYCLLGGVWGILGHTSALASGIVSKPPLLQGAAPGAVLFIAFFEYIFYWSMILLVSLLGREVWRRLKEARIFG